MLIFNTAHNNQNSNLNKNIEKFINLHSLAKLFVIYIIYMLIIYLATIKYTKVIYFC